MRNYKETLKQLEADGKVAVRSLRGIRRRGTFADHLLVSFPASNGDGE
ncbi:MAG: hypothetical protein AB7S92_08700 [Parvibaculaceae bacterium]